MNAVNPHLMFAPALAQMFLTMFLFVLLGVRKARAVGLKQVDLKAAALDRDAWPASVQKVSNNIANQFETPVLFYVLCVVLVQLNAVSATSLALAWAYVASRAVHAWVHVHSNYVPLRLGLFIAGLVILLALGGMGAWAVV